MLSVVRGEHRMAFSGQQEKQVSSVSRSSSTMRMRLVFGTAYRPFRLGLLRARAFSRLTLGCLPTFQGGKILAQRLNQGAQLLQLKLDVTVHSRSLTPSHSES